MALEVILATESLQETTNNKAEALRQAQLAVRRRHPDTGSAGTREARRVAALLLKR